MSGNLTHSEPTGPGAPRVNCSFLRQHLNERSIDTCDIAVGTGSSAWRQRMKDAAHVYADALAYRMWAVPHLRADQPGAWSVYSIGLGTAFELLRVMPNRAAAEMWMLHDG